MSFSYEILKNRSQRISLVSFQRATMVPPKLNHPEIDNRGYFREATLGIDRGPVVGVTQDDTVFVELRRDRIDNKAPLFVTSSDPKVLKVSIPVNKISTNGYSAPSDKLYNWNSQTLQLTGTKGGGGVMPKAAKVEIRYGSNQGVIIGELTVYVFTKLSVNVVPHIVNLRGPQGYSVSNIFDVNPVFEIVKAIWQPCGIQFFVGAPEDEFIQSNIFQAGKWAHPVWAEMSAMAKRHHPDAINIYFVNEIVSTKGVLAYAIKPTEDAGKRCIIAQTNVSSIDDLGQTLAHEIGHYLGLEHTDKTQQDNERKDIWSKFRMLMHPTSTASTCLITMKDLYDQYNPTINQITDPEWLAVRKHINSKDGPYK